MTRASLDVIRRTLTVEWPKIAEAEARAFLVQTAREGNRQTLLEQQARAGIAPNVKAYANSPTQTDIEKVVLPGPIVFNYDYRHEIVEAALRLLREASPREEGEYMESHSIYLNGKLVDNLPEKMGENDEIILSNPVPYARRLEIGKTKSGRSFVADVEPRIYERVAKGQVLKRYGNLARISFNYVTLPDAWVIKGGRRGLSSHYTTSAYGGLGRRSKQGGTPHSRKRRLRVGETVRAPAIIIEALA
jgi:hypothetical protein